jgi:phytoene synthase
VDDVVDEPGVEDPARALNCWRRDLQACYEGDVEPAAPESRRLRPHITRFGLPRDAFDAVIDGVEMDLLRHRYQTFSDLYEYCYRVASAVGLICIEIFGYRNGMARQYAVDLGVALQLTNIVRDVGADLARGRIYLPMEDLARFGCSEDDLAGRVVTPRVAALLEFQCQRAREYYARARAALPPEDARRLVAAEIMRAIYFALLERVERRNYQVLGDRVRVAGSRRALIAAAIWLKTMLGHPLSS